MAISDYLDVWVGSNRPASVAIASYSHIVPVIPPLSEIHCAVIHRLFSDTNRSTASAMSAAVPRRAAALVIAIMPSCISLGDPSGF